MATDGDTPLHNFIKCFSKEMLKRAINIAISDEKAGREMLEWLEEKRTNLIANYKVVQRFFKDELDCEDIIEELKYNPRDSIPTQIQRIAEGLKHILCMVRKEIKDLLFSPNLEVSEEDMKKIAAQKKNKKRKGNPNSSENSLKRARLDREQTDKNNSQNPTDDQKSVTQNRFLKEIVSLDKDKNKLTNEKEDLKTCITEHKPIHT